MPFTVGRTLRFQVLLAAVGAVERNGPRVHAVSPARFRGPARLPIPPSLHRLPSSLVLCSPLARRDALRRRLPSSLVPRSSVQAAPRPGGSLTCSSVQAAPRPSSSLTRIPYPRRAPGPAATPRPASGQLERGAGPTRNTCE